MVRLAQTPYYEFDFDPEKNRLHFRMSGFWRSPATVPNYLTDWQRALRHTAPGFTLLVDVRAMVTHPAAVAALHQQAITACRAHGVAYAVEVAPTDRIALLQTADLAQDEQFSFSRATDAEQANRLLDQLTSLPAPTVSGAAAARG